jgi:hypothetical protein
MDGASPLDSSAAAAAAGIVSGGSPTFGGVPLWVVLALIEFIVLGFATAGLLRF